MRFLPGSCHMTVQGTSRAGREKAPVCLQAQGEMWDLGRRLALCWKLDPTLTLLSTTGAPWVCLRIFAMQKRKEDTNTRVLQLLQAPETWGLMLHHQQLLLKSVGITSTPKLSDGQSSSQGSLHTTTAVEMKRSWLNQPKGGLLFPSGFPLAIPSDGADGFWPIVFPPGESSQCCRITHLPFLRGYLGFLPLSTEQSVGSNPKAI